MKKKDKKKKTSSKKAEKRAKKARKGSKREKGSVDKNTPLLSRKDQTSRADNVFHFVRTVCIEMVAHLLVFEAMQVYSHSIRMTNEVANIVTNMSNLI